jgi:hypothetical protein
MRNKTGESLLFFYRDIFLKILANIIKVCKQLADVYQYFRRTAHSLTLRNDVIYFFLDHSVLRYSQMTGENQHWIE